MSADIPVCRVCGCTDDNACLVHPRSGRIARFSELLNEDGSVDPVMVEALAAEGVTRCSWLEGYWPATCSACLGPATSSGAPPPTLLYDAYGRPIR